MSQMTDFLKSNFGQIVALFAAAVPILVALLKIFGTRPEKIKAPLDSRIKTKTIERTEVDKEIWDELSLIALRRAALIIAIALLVIVLLIVIHDLIDILVLLLLIVLLIVIISSAAAKIVFSPYKYRSKDSQEAKFYVFKDATIIVEGDFDIIFAKAQEAIIGKHIKYIEANAYKGTIDAYHDGDTTVTQGTISVTIQKQDGGNRYKVVIDFIPSSYKLMHLFLRILPLPPGLQSALDHPSGLMKRLFPEPDVRRLKAKHRRLEARRIEEKAKIINHFLNKFLTTTAAK